MSDKAQAIIDELVAACIAFGRQVEPDWQTRIESAQRELREYIAELEEFIGQLIEVGDAMSNAQSMWVAEEDKWDALVKDWKESEE